MSAAELLRAAAARVSVGWCQGVSAMDADGFDVGIADPTACRWCLFGAIFLERGLVMFTGVNDFLLEAIGEAKDDLSRATVLLWNDAPGRTQSEVVAALVRAAELAEAQSC